MFLDVHDLIGIIRYGNYSILSVFEAYLVLCLHRLIFNELSNAVKTTPSLIIKQSPNWNCLTSFGLNLISSWLKISQISNLFLELDILPLVVVASESF